ncbi:MAG: hypothetical protein MUC88_00215 [Planctomycetes bacterium]|jgi:hypothetical protein|nr:hypothetical protein [Planctomycetota bacterium]
MNQKSLLKALRLLVGAKIVDVGLDDDMPWVELHMPDDSALVLGISADEEGNGPGALLGLWELARAKGQIR